MYAFYGVKTNTLIGITRSKKDRDKIMRSRSKDLVCIKVDDDEEDINISSASEYHITFYKESFGQNISMWITNEEREALSLFIINKAAKLLSESKAALYDILNLKISEKDKFKLRFPLVAVNSRMTKLMETCDIDIIFLQASDYFNMRQLLKEFFDLKREDNDMSEFYKYTIY